MSLVRWEKSPLCSMPLHGCFHFSLQSFQLRVPISIVLLSSKKFASTFFLKSSMFRGVLGWFSAFFFLKYNSKNSVRTNEMAEIAPLPCTRIAAGHMLRSECAVGHVASAQPTADDLPLTQSTVGGQRTFLPQFGCTAGRLSLAVRSSRVSPPRT